MTGAIAAADPASKVSYTFDDPGRLHDAIKEYGFIPIMGSGQPFVVQEFEGGYLLGGAPINVHMNGVWYEGQKELLQPYWAAGSIPPPPSELLSLPVAPMPENVAAAYQAYKNPVSVGLSTTAMLGIGGLLVALMFFGSKGSRTWESSGESDFG